MVTIQNTVVFLGQLFEFLNLANTEHNIGIELVSRFPMNTILY